MVDLNPYFKLIGLAVSKFKGMIKSNFWLITIATLFIMGLGLGMDLKKPTLFSSKAVLKSDQASFEILRGVLNSLEANIENSGTPLMISSNQDDGNAIELYDLKSNLNISYQDSILLSINHEDGHKLNDLNYDYSINVELLSNSNSDSLGDLFITFLNLQDNIIHEREKSLDKKKTELFELNLEIQNIDSTISRLLKTDPQSDIDIKDNALYFVGTGKSIYDLLKYKNELIEERLRLNNELKYRKAQDVFAITNFSKPTEIRKTSILSMYSWVAALAMSLLIVLALQVVRSIIKS